MRELYDHSPIYSIALTLSTDVKYTGVNYDTDNVTDKLARHLDFNIKEKKIERTVLGWHPSMASVSTTNTTNRSRSTNISNTRKSKKRGNRKAVTWSNDSNSNTTIESNISDSNDFSTPSHSNNNSNISSTSRKKGGRHNKTKKIR